MGDELVSAEEARGLLAEIAGSEPWSWANGQVTDWTGLFVCNAEHKDDGLLLAAAPDLARTVIAQDERIRNLSAWADELAEELQEATARAERAEGEGDEARTRGINDERGRIVSCIERVIGRLVTDGGMYRADIESALNAWRDKERDEAERERDEARAERDRLARIVDSIGLLNPEGIPCHCWHGWATTPSPKLDGVGCRDCGGSAGKPGTGWLILPADDARDPSDP